MPSPDFVEQLTAKLTAGDGRMKIVWLEDQYTQHATDAKLTGARLGDWYSIVAVPDLEGLRSLADEAASPLLGQEYALSGLPADVYLTDLRMCENKDSRETPCELAEHYQHGVHTNGAGFLASLLTAVQFGNHPQAVLAYSGHDKEFEHTWQLASFMCPSSVAINKDVDKRQPVSDLVRKAVGVYRGALANAVQKGDVHIPTFEEGFWSRKSRQVDVVPASHRIWFCSDYGFRGIMLGSLFWDDPSVNDRNEVPVGNGSEFRKWFDSLVSSDPRERQARELATFFFQLRKTEASRQVYSILRNGERMRALQRSGRLPEAPPTIKWLVPWTDLSGLKDGEREAMVRLAVLYLLILEMAERTRKEPLSLSLAAAEVWSQIVVPGLTSGNLESEVDSLSLGNDGERSQFASSLLEALTEIVAALEAGGMSLSNDDDIFENLRQFRPIDEVDLVQLLDPLPSSWDRPTLGHDKKIGKGLRDWGFPDALALLAGNGGVLHPHELKLARAFAREQLLAPASFPLWLK